MANNQANRLTLPLNSQINLSRDKTQVENFDKFNRKNGTIYGGNLASFFTKSENNETGTSDNIVYDSNGNQYSIDTSGRFCKNGTAIKTLGSNSNVTLSKNNKNYVCAYYGERFYIKENDKSTLYYEKLTTGDKTSISLDNPPYKCIAVKVVPYGGGAYGIFYLLEYYNGKSINLYYKYFDNGAVVFNKYEQIASTNINYSNILIQAGKFKINSTDYIGLTVYYNAGENVKEVNCKSFIIEDWTDSNTMQIYDFNSWNNTKAVTASVEKNKIGFMNRVIDEVKLYSFQNYANIDKSNGIAFISEITTYGISGISWNNGTGILTVEYNPGYEDTQAISAIISGYTILDGFYLQTLYYKTASGKAQFIQMCNKDTRNYVQALFSVDDPDAPTEIYDGKTYLQWIGTGSTYYRLIRNGDVIGIAHFNTTELVEFFSVDKNFPIMYDSYNSQYYIVYTDVNGNGNELELQTPTKIIGIINDRYVLVGTTSQFNAYDIEDDKFYNFCSACTSTINYGIVFDTNILDSTETRLLADISEHTEFTLEDLSDYKKYVCAMSYNNLYEIENFPFMGIQLAPFYYYKLDYGSQNNYSVIAMAKDYGVVDFYESIQSENIYPVYQCTFYGFKRVVNSKLEGLTYTVGDDIIMPPALTSEFIFSYLNSNYVINGGKGYPLIQWNNDFVFGYTSLSYIENIKAVFVIQTMTYFITDKKLIYAQYSGNELVQSQIVADITGLLYLGSLYDRALFFSQYNRKIYQFTGDSILTVFMECNAISEINAVNYIPMSNSIILSTVEADGTKAVYIIQQNNMIRLENVNFKRIFTTENENDSIILVDDDNIVYLNNEEYAGFEKGKLKIETCYFGIGQEQKSVFSCYYIRLFDENKSAGSVKARMYTLTDDEEKTLEKTVEILAPDWTEGGTLLLKFQPALQEATATKLYIESDFDIQNIYAEFNATGTQTGAKTRLEI